MQMVIPSSLPQTTPQEQFFTNPSPFWVNGSIKRNSFPPDFIHNQTKKPLYMHGFSNPPWVKVKLKEVLFQDTFLAEDVPNLEFQDRFALLNLIKQCGSEKDLCKTRRIHANLTKNRLIIKDIYIGTAILSTYAKCGALKEAEEVFEQLLVRNVITWNALISGYVQHGHGYKALKLFRDMRNHEITPDKVTYICIIKACGIIGSLEIGEGIYGEIREKRLLQKYAVIGNTLVDMFTKCGALDRARELFDELPTRNVVSWTALIAGYAQNGLGEEALKCFKQMQDEGISPNTVTFICVLKACGIVRSLDIGEAINVEVRKQDLLQNNILLGTALVDMYAKCGVLEKAREVFGQLRVHDVVCWNALISGYTQEGLCDEALECFINMHDEGILPDVATYTCILKVCGMLRNLEVGEDIHTKIRNQGLLGKDITLCNALVDMYAKCGVIQKAQEVFEHLSIRDVVTWNALLAGYNQHGLGDETVKLFKHMQDEAVPNVVTYICVLKSCGIVGSLEIGELIDVEIRKRGLLREDVVLGTTLVDMYAKCGAPEKAQDIFRKLPVRNTITWTALLSGYAQLGQAKVVLDLFKKMRAEDVMPDTVTFLVLLMACTHSGLLEEGEILFDDMCAAYCLTPTHEHYTCMIDLFGRAGHFDKAKVVLEKVSSSDRLPQLLAILGACCKWVNVKLGRWAFHKSVELDERCVAAYISMENIYLGSGMI